MDTHLLSMLTLLFIWSWSWSLTKPFKAQVFRELQVKFCQNIEAGILSGCWCWGMIVLFAMFDYEIISLCLTMPAKGYLFREPSCFNAFGYISCGWFTRPVHMVSSIVCKPKTGHKVKIFAYPLSIFPHSLVKTLAPRHTHMHHAKSCTLMISLCLGTFSITLM